jgi:hypothetical protein
VARKESTSRTRKSASAARGTARAQAAPKKKIARPGVAKRVRPLVPGNGAARVPRRAIFIDVENTSSDESLTEVLEGLKIDRAVQPTELTAVGNWRAVGQRLGRHLASLGAQLVHSAPATGVRDWSDLWIAVAAGCWLGQALPGDVLEIVSNDRAFDAVGDAAAARGVVYHRLLHRRGAVPTHATEPKPAARRSRGGRRRRRGRPGQAAAVAVLQATDRVTAAPAIAHRVADEPHGASREQMVLVISRLTHSDPGRWVNLDVLEKSLKAEGFARPPGSPRLVTRLRMLKEVEVDSHGRVHLTPGGAPPHITIAREHIPGDPGAVADPRQEIDPAAEPAARRAPPKRRRRRRSKSSSGSAVGEATSIETSAPPRE